MISLDQVKSLYIGSGMSAEEIAKATFLPLAKITQIIDDHKLPELRREYIRQGFIKIQDQQIDQAQRLLDVELNFKKLRLIQLEKELEDYMAYYGRHGDFYKRHPVSGDILKDSDGIPMQLYLPDVTKEIKALKESVSLSDGLKKLLADVDAIINGKPKGEAADPNIIDMAEIDGLFKPKKG